MVFRYISNVQTQTLSWDWTAWQREEHLLNSHKLFIDKSTPPPTGPPPPFPRLFILAYRTRGAHEARTTQHLGYQKADRVVPFYLVSTFLNNHHVHDSLNHKNYEWFDFHDYNH
jgi:hypothetical protein